MTDETTTVTATAPAPALTVSSAVTTDATAVAHDAERDTHHGLSHLEVEFVAEWNKAASYSETQAKKLLAWVASKL
jgi:hypothetical protein